MGKSKSVPLAIAAVALAGSGWMLRSYTPPLAAPRPAALGATVPLLVRFGPSDTETAVWDGSVEVASSEIVSLRSWLPRPGETVGGREWKMSSAWSSIFQCRSWEAELARPGRRELHYPSLVAGVRGLSAVLRFRTLQGSSPSMWRIQPSAGPPPTSMDM